MKSSYIDYSMSVIVSRALPDVRDGFKPVHRRILFGMMGLGNTSDKPYKKSARVVGEVLGKYHPHGDSSVYGALVRMAQPWAMRYMLVDGQGNYGSVDGDSAAAMLYAMNQLYDLGLSRRELMKRGVQIGADVPYCLMRGTALAEGIGEKLTQLPPMIKCPVLIAKPSISVSTKFVYQNLKLDEQTNHPDIDALMKDIREKDFDGVCAHMGNVLESVTIPNYPVIAEIKQQMMRSGAKASMMSGSGPTVFGLFEDGETAKRALREMKRSGLAKQVYLTTIYNNRRK